MPPSRGHSPRPERSPARRRRALRVVVKIAWKVTRLQGVNEAGREEKCRCCGGRCQQQSLESSGWKVAPAWCIMPGDLPRVSHPELPMHLALALFMLPLTVGADAAAGTPPDLFTRGEAVALDRVIPANERHLVPRERWQGESLRRHHRPGRSPFRCTIRSRTRRAAGSSWTAASVSPTGWCDCPTALCGRHPGRPDGHRGED